MTLIHKIGDNSDLLSTIDGTQNRIIEPDRIDRLSGEITQYNWELRRVIESSKTLRDLELNLREKFPSTQEYYIEGVRCATCIWWADTHIRRAVESILCHNWETDHTFATNMGEHVIDPIGWASKVVAPSDWYGLNWKISALRPSSEDFNPTLHTDLMNIRIACEWKWAAVERSDLETAYMPTFAIHGGYELVQQFSQKLQEWDISTAKHVLLNS